MATYDNIPLTWNDPMFSGVTDSGSVTLQNGGTLSYKSITATGDTASVVGTGAFTLDHVRISSREAVRIGGDGDVVISNSYLDAEGQGADHADTIQAYAPGSTGNVTITNTTIVAHNHDATAGMFIADGYDGSLTFDNVVFQGGPYGLRIAADGGDITVSLKDVYFVGPFAYDELLFQEVNSDIHITQWENVRYATIVNGELVPGALISPPLPVEGGAGGISTTIDDFSNDSGTDGDGITNDSTLTLTGKAAANSPVKVFDGTTQIGSTTANSSGAWTYTTAALSDGNHSLKAQVGTGAASSALAVKIDTAAPNAATIATPTKNANGSLTLAGTAEAGSVVKVYDGTAQIGTATANSSGAWGYTTGVLSTGSHSLTAKATDAAGNTGAASAAVSVNTSTTPPPTAPSAPTIASFSNDTGTAGDKVTSDSTLTLAGNAAANSTVRVYDGTTQIGTATANSSGAWTYTTAALSDGSHNLTAKATTASGTSATSSALAVTIDTKAPTAPTIEPVSASARTAASAVTTATDSVALTGLAEANSTVKVFEGSTQIGTVKAGTDGAWNYSVSSLSQGSHSFTAKATDAAGNTSAASAAISVNTTTPTSPTPTPTPSEPIESAGATSLVESGDKYYLKSSSGSGPSLKYGGKDFVEGTDGTWAPIGAEKTATGYLVAWKEASTGQYTAWNTDNNGNYVSHVSALTGSASGGSVSGTNSALKSLETSFHQDLNSDGVIGASSANAPLSPVALTTVSKNGSDIVTIKGVADANSQIKLYDGNASLGTVKTAADGSWSFNTSSAVSDTVHTYTAKQIDSTGQVVGTSGSAILGSSGSNTLKGTSGDDLFRGNGGQDTFAFAANFGNDVITDFGAGRRSPDVVQFSRTVFDDFADVMAHASQQGQDVVIDAQGGSALTLKNTSLSSLDRSDFHFA
jgi:hypothetical protein